MIWGVWRVFSLSPLWRTVMGQHTTRGRSRHHGCKFGTLWRRPSLYSQAAPKSADCFTWQPCVGSGSSGFPVAVNTLQKPVLWRDVSLAAAGSGYMTSWAYQTFPAGPNYVINKTLIRRKEEPSEGLANSFSIVGKFIPFVIMSLRLLLKYGQTNPRLKDEPSWKPCQLSLRL